MTAILTGGRGASRCAAPAALRCGAGCCLPGLAVACADARSRVRAARARPVKGEVTRHHRAAAMRGIVVQLAEEVESTVKVAGGIVVINFKQPVDVAVDRIDSSARRTMSAPRAAIPTARGLRIALARKVTVNSMAAGERLFVDLLPETWTGAAARPAAGGGRGAGAARARGRAATARSSAPVNQKKPAADAGARSRASRPSRATSSSCPTSIAGHHRARQGQAHADVRRAAEIRSGRRQGDAAAGGASRSTRVAEYGCLDGRVSPSPARSTSAPSARTTTTSSMSAPSDAKERGTRRRRSRIAGGARGPRRARDGSGESAARAPASKRRNRAGRRPRSAAAAAGRQPQPHAAAPQDMPRRAACRAAAPAAGEARAAPSPASRRAAEPQPPDAWRRPEPPLQRPRSAESPRPSRRRRRDAAATPPRAAPSRRPSPRPRKRAIRCGRGRACAAGRQPALVFPFAAPTPAAVFRRADTLWLVFDTAAPIDLRALQADTSQHDPQRADRRRCRTGRWCGSSSSGRGSISVAPKARPGRHDRRRGRGADAGRSASRATSSAPRAPASTIPFDEPRKLHRIADPDIGDTLLVVTALGAGARLPEGAGFRRIPRARLDARRGDPADRRRRAGRAVGRQDRDRPAGRADAVGRRRSRPAQVASAFRPVVFDRSSGASTASRISPSGNTS